MNKIKSFRKIFSGLLTLFIVVLLFTITFSQKVEGQASKKGIILNKTSALVEVGKTIKLTVSNTKSTVKWSTKNKRIATVKNGLVTVKNVGTVTIVATSGKNSATCKITVYKPAKKIVLSAESDYIETGDTFNVSAQIMPEDATYKTFAWSVENNDEGYPTVEQVSKNKFKAVREGTATIIAYQKNTKKKYKRRVEVKEALGPFHIEMNNYKKVNALATFVGGHVLIKGFIDDSEGTVYDDYDQVPKFRYSIKDTKIASVDDRGQITAKAVGSTSVIVTAENGKSISCKLTVTKDKETLSLDAFYASNFFDRVGAANYGAEVDWSKADQTYMFKHANNQIGVFNHISTETGQSLQLYLYDQDFHYISEKTIALPYSEWGGFYQAEDGNYYAAVGQQNTEQDNSKIVFSIVKFNADFKEVGRCNITGGETNTRIPYNLGFARMAMDGTTLIVHTDRENYSSFGVNHQSNITFAIDSTSMQQSYVGSYFPYNHISHSFNQFVKVDGKNLIYVDHGDAFPRAVVMQTHYNFRETGISDEYSSIFSKPKAYQLNLLNIVGGTGDNYTGTTVNGFELGNNHNLVAGVSIPHDSITADMLYKYDVKNVYVALSSKDGTESELKWLTNYKSGGGVSADNLRMVKLEDDQFALIFSMKNGYDVKGTGLMIIDSNGNILKKKEYDINFSSYTQPMYYNHSIIWIDSMDYADEFWDLQETKEKAEMSQFVRLYLE